MVSIPRWVAVVLSAALALCLLLANSLLSVHASATNIRLYRDLWVRLGVAEDTGMSMEDLTAAGEKLVDYLTGKSVSPQILTRINGEERLLYNDKELLHLEDVRGLFLSGLTAEWLATVASFALAFLLIKSGKHKEASVAMYASSILTVIILALAGMAASSDFTLFWDRFHRVTFDNDLWLLDPGKDWLIRMFPEPFFYAVVRRVAIHAAAGALTLALAGSLTGFLGKRRSGPEDAR
ncbi:MAG TPA: TIGR01906 family membrane protein [Firmicutes bacterium]|nr:TIGR01906 family membrane protein [Candidatus Fermentithermobacillaceae bacterium]